MKSSFTFKRIGVSSFWQQNSPSFLQTMRKVSEVNFIGHPFILSFEKKNWNKSTYFGISKGVYLICVNSMSGSVVS